MKKIIICFLIILFLNICNINFNVKSFNNKEFEDIFTDLFIGVSKITFTGNPGILLVDTPSIPIVLSSNLSNPKNQISIAGVKYGEGFILAFCHDGFFSDSNLDYFDNKIFTKNILSKSKKKKISISISHSEWFNKTNSLKFINYIKILGFEVEFIESSIKDITLLNTGVFISGAAWSPFTNDEINYIHKFIENGGIALILSLGWSWLSFNKDKKIEDLPANQLCKNFNIKWIDGYLTENTSNIYKEATVFSIFYPKTLNYITYIENSLNNIENTLKGYSDLNTVLKNNINVRNLWINSMETIYQYVDFYNYEKRDLIFNKIIEIINKYPYYFKKDHIFKTNENILSWSREKFSILLYGYSLPLNDKKKKLILDTLNITGLYKEIWDKYSILILDNNSIYYKNLEYIKSFLDSIPYDLHNLKLIMIGRLLGEPIENLYLLNIDDKKYIYDLSASYATNTKIGYAINLWDIKIDSDYENPFPNDVEGRIDPYFSGALSHEVNHIIDMNIILKDENLIKQRETLLKRAGNNRLNYLRSMFENNFFINNPQEFIASIGNQWFCDTWNTLELAIKRFNNGYKEPINQFLFFAKILSLNTNIIPFYNREENGTKLIKLDIRCEKINNGQITRIYDNKNNKLYTFDLDSEGFVKNINISDIKITLSNKENLLIITSKKIIDSNVLNDYINYKSSFYNIYIESIENIEKNYSGFDLPEKIRNYLKTKYTEFNLKFLLLIGNPYKSGNQTKYSTGGTIPMRYCYPDPNNHNRSTDISEDGSVPTDYYYADLTGDWDSDKDKYFGEYGQDSVDFQNELNVGRIPFDDLNVIKEILDRSIKYEIRNIEMEKKNFLFAGSILTYGNDCERVDAASLYENIIKDILNIDNFEVFRMYEKEGIEPSKYNCDLNLNRDNLINRLSSIEYDLVSLVTIGGYLDKISKRIWFSDNGNNICEPNELKWIDLLTTSDAKNLSLKFSNSIYLLMAFWPLSIDWDDDESIGISLLKKNAVSVIGNTRNYWFTCGWDEFKDGGSLSIFYKFFENLIFYDLTNTKTVGESLYDSLVYYSKNFMFKDWDYSTWTNLFSFSTLFGDPTLSIFQKIIPPSKIEDLKFEITKDNYVLLSWSKPKQGTFKIKGYYLYRGEAIDNLKLIAQLDENKISFIDPTVESGKTYYYYIVAFDERNNLSEPSNIIKASVPIKDLSPPVLEIYSPKDSEIRNISLITIKGKTYDELSKVKELYINSILVSISETGEFEYIINLNEGINEIRIISIDTYNNKVEKLLKVIIDTKPPILTVSIPNETYDSNYFIKGFVKDEGLSGIKNNKIKINGIEVILDQNLNFEYNLNLKEGENKIIFELEDNANNKKIYEYSIIYRKRIIIILQIGNKNMVVNNQIIEIEVAPLIIEGRTYLPMRYVVEVLGGTVLWDNIEKKITILFKDKMIELWVNKNIAKVNGIDKFIDSSNINVTPKIINGRTMLPIRFVAENLGCKVDWNAVDKTIKITYPNE